MLSNIIMMASVDLGRSRNCAGACTSSGVAVQTNARQADLVTGGAGIGTVSLGILLAILAAVALFLGDLPLHVF